MKKFFSIGYVTKDVIASEVSLGGSALYTALCAQRLGYDSTVITSADFEVTKLLQKLPIRAYVQPSERTTTFEHRYGADGSRESRCTAQAGTLDLSILPVLGLDGEGDVLMISPNMHEVSPDAIGKYAKTPFALLPQGWFRSVDADENVVHAKNIHAHSACRAAFVVVSAQDVSGDEQGWSWCREHSEACLRTDGARPMQTHANGREGTIPVPFIAKEVDPTGAGDVFSATTWIAMTEGLSIKDAALVGSVAASFKVEGRGLDALPSRASIQDRMEKLGDLAFENRSLVVRFLKEMS